MNRCKHIHVVHTALPLFKRGPKMECQDCGYVARWGWRFFAWYRP